MEQTWRWFGPDDVVSSPTRGRPGPPASSRRCTISPTALSGPGRRSRERQALIGADASLGLRWSVVESVPVAEPIKLGEGDLEPLFDNYRQSLRNLADCGGTTVCYNFMPVLDWTRTELARAVAGRRHSLRFNAPNSQPSTATCCERPGAEAEHSPEVVRRARAWYTPRPESDRRQLLGNIMAGCPAPRSLRRPRPSGDARPLQRHRRGGFARKPRPLPAGGDSDGGRGRDPHVHPSRRSAAPAHGPAPHRVQRRRSRLHPRRGPADERRHPVQRLARGHPANDVPAMARRLAGRIRFAHLPETSPRIRMGRSWKRTISAAIWIWSPSSLPAGGAEAAAGCGRGALAHPIPSRPRA